MVTFLNRDFETKPRNSRQRQITGQGYVGIQLTGAISLNPPPLLNFARILIEFQVGKSLSNIGNYRVDDIYNWPSKALTFSLLHCHKRDGRIDRQLVIRQTETDKDTRRDGHTDRQTDRRTDRQTDRQTDKRIDKQING